MQTQQFAALASAARTAGGTVDLGSMPGGFIEMMIYIDATVVTGTTPSMIVTYQCSHDGVTFFDHTAGAAITVAGKQLIRLANTIGKFGRLSYAMTGTAPNFTFSANVGVKRCE